MCFTIKFWNSKITCRVSWQETYHYVPLSSRAFVINFHCYHIAHCIKKNGLAGCLMCEFCLSNDPSINSWTNKAILARHWVLNVGLWHEAFRRYEDDFVSDNYWLDMKEWVGKYRIPHCLKSLNVELAYVPIIPLTGINLMKWQHTLPKHCMPIFIAAIFVISRSRNNPSHKE